MTAGRSNHEIGVELQLTPKTVRNYVLSILTTLGVCDRTQAVIRARDAGLSWGGGLCGPGGRPSVTGSRHPRATRRRDTPGTDP